jgi:hypothetical protein
MLKAMGNYPCVQPDCAHKDAHDAYNEIITHAQREVRYRAYTAVADRLPAELADMVAGATIVAEKVHKPPQRSPGWGGGYEGFDLNCDKSRMIFETNLDFGYEPPSSLPMNGQSDREYDTDNLIPRPRHPLVRSSDLGSSGEDEEDPTDSEESLEDDECSTDETVESTEYDSMGGAEDEEELDGH